MPQLPARAGLRGGCADFLALEDGIQPGDELTHVERITVEPTAVPTVSSTSLVTPSESSAAAKAQWWEVNIFRNSYRTEVHDKSSAFVVLIL